MIVTGTITNYVEEFIKDQNNSKLIIDTDNKLKELYKDHQYKDKDDILNTIVEICKPLFTKYITTIIIPHVLSAYMDYSNHKISVYLYSRCISYTYRYNIVSLEENIYVDIDNIFKNKEVLSGIIKKKMHLSEMALYDFCDHFCALDLLNEDTGIHKVLFRNANRVLLEYLEDVYKKDNSKEFKDIIVEYEYDMDCEDEDNGYYDDNYDYEKILDGNRYLEEIG